MDILRTPDACFADLPDFPFSPHYTTVPDGEGGDLRVAYIDEGPRDGQVVLCLHGEPTWSFLYRKVIPVLRDGGARVVAPDLIGFGRSDKPASASDYSYQRLVGWMGAWLEAVDLRDITLVCQDWGGLIGLRLVTALPKRFSRVVVANTGLPTGDMRMSEAFMAWRKFSQETPEFPVGAIINGACTTELSPAEVAAYNAPFPEERYKAGARILPSLVPITPDDPEAQRNQEAWQVLERWQKPFLTAFSDGDPVTRGANRLFEQRIPGARGQAHITLPGGHFLQEDCGPQLAQVTLDFMDREVPGRT